jgi:phosphatidylglycerophosphate synthase
MWPPVTWLKQLTGPVLDAQRHVYGKLNTSSMSFMQRTAAKGLWPSAVTADAITTARTALVIPTVVLLSNGHTVLPAALVVANAAFDYVDGAVARWEQTDPVRRSQLANRREGSIHAANELHISARGRRLRATWGAYYDAIADKAFAVPVWMVCFPLAAAGDPILQTALLMHVGIELASGYVRTKAYFDEPSPASWIPNASPVSAKKAEESGAANTTPGNGTSSVVAGAAGKAKQALSMLGTALIMIPAVKTVGTVLLVTSVPLALLSLQQKISHVVVYAGEWYSIWLV